MEWKFFLPIRGENALMIEYLTNSLYDSSTTFHIRIVSCEYYDLFLSKTTLITRRNLLGYISFSVNIFLPFSPYDSRSYQRRFSSAVAKRL